jgi:hypothetical protein
MLWVLVAVAVGWVFALVLVFALCLSARRIDEAIVGADDVAAPPRSDSAEPAAGLDDITVRRTALS